MTGPHDDRAPDGDLLGRRRRVFRTVNFALAVIGLLVIAGAMAAMIAIAARAAAQAEPDARKYFYHLAWIAAAMLGVALVMLAWTCVRHLRRGRAYRTRPTRYVDAWGEAGRRFQPPGN
ncbi:MAG: hypothetical protein KGY99_09145 [Phycisphaerae bacterium]|nr:hypothetical protein [Phycisphaerae bacterium]